MTISYPLTPPSTKTIRLSLTGIESVAISRSPFTYQSQVQEFNGTLLSAEVSVPPMERAEAEEWVAFMMKLRGQRGTFYLLDPLGKTPRGIGTGTPLVNGAGQTGQTLNSDGWSPSTTGILKTGDYIQLGIRLHKVLNDADSNASGQVIGMDIWPRLRETPGDNDPITVNSAKGLFRLANNTNTLWDVDETKIYGISFSAIEAI